VYPTPPHTEQTSRGEFSMLPPTFANANGSIRDLKNTDAEQHR
jgi:hypothetical protein